MVFFCQYPLIVEEDEWILASGDWDDTNFWYDTEVWID